MNQAVAIAALGFVATLSAAGMTALLHRSGDRRSQLFNARLSAYAECFTSLYDYERASFHRAKTRIDGWSESERAPARDEAYRANTRARSPIGQVAMLTGDKALPDRLASVRGVIGDYSNVESRDQLTALHQAVVQQLDEALSAARVDLTGKP